MPGFLLLYHILSLLLLASCQDTVIISLTPPEDAVNVSKDLISYSIEGDRWESWVVNTSDSQTNFFLNTLDNLRQLTGAPPQIRIGANSADNTFFGGNVFETIFPEASTKTPYPEATNVTVDESYYKAAQYLPQNTLVTFGVNLKKGNLPATLLEAMTIKNVFSSPSIRNAGIQLEAFEVGNEADLYSSNGERPPTYTVGQYVSEWNQVAGMIALTQQSVKFWGGSFAYSTSHFSARAILKEGIISSLPGSLISTFAQHHYSGNYCSGKVTVKGGLQDLMSKRNIRSNLSVFKPDIEATIAKGLAYVLGETNSYACHGAPGISNTAGAALWALDYLLFASQLGISRVFFHHGIGFKYNLIQPIALSLSPLNGSSLSPPLSPHIQPQYYAAIIAAEAIGNSSNTKVIELNIDDNTISGYAFYLDGQLKKAIIINLQAFLSNTTSDRQSTHVDLTFGSGSGPSKMDIKRLSVQYADDTSGLTWGGQTFETVDGRASGVLDISTDNVSNGVDIQETEVVLLTFQS